MFNYYWDTDTYKNIQHNITKGKPYGYCWCNLHRGYLSKSNVKTHNCLKKHCKYFVPSPLRNFDVTLTETAIRKAYYQFINKSFQHNELPMAEYRKLKAERKLQPMVEYLKEHNMLPVPRLVNPKEKKKSKKPGTKKKSSKQQGTKKKQEKRKGK